MNKPVILESNCVNATAGFFENWDTTTKIVADARLIIAEFDSKFAMKSLHNICNVQAHQASNVILYVHHHVYHQLF